MGIFTSLLQKRKDIDDDIKELFKSECKKFLTEFPGVKAITFTAYRPYFNDGDACVYSINGMDVSLTKEFKKENNITSYYDDEFEDDNNDELKDDPIDNPICGDTVYHLSKYKQNKTIQEIVSRIKDLQKIPDEVAESLFGDDALVCIDLNGISISHFQHD